MSNKRGRPSRNVHSDVPHGIMTERLALSTNEANSMPENETITEMITDVKNASIGKKEKGKDPIIFRLLTQNIGRSTSWSLAKRAKIFYADENGKIAPRDLRWQSSMSSPFYDEQGGSDIPDDTFKPTFNNGQIVLEPNDTVAIEHLRLRPENIGAPNRPANARDVYYEFKPAEEKKKQIKKTQNQLDAIRFYNQMDFDLIKAIARCTPQGRHGINEMEEEEIRVIVANLAMNETQFFFELKDDPATALKSLIYDAVDYGIIDNITKPNHFVWGSNKRDIVAYPIGTDAERFLANWLTTSSEGKTVYLELQKEISKRE